MLFCKRFVDKAEGFPIFEKGEKVSFLDNKENFCQIRMRKRKICSSRLNFYIEESINAAVFGDKFDLSSGPGDLVC